MRDTEIKGVIHMTLRTAKDCFLGEYRYARIPRLISIVDLLFIKTWRAEDVFKKGDLENQRLLEIINMAMWGLIQLEHPSTDPDKIMEKDAAGFHYKNAIDDFFDFIESQIGGRLYTLADLPIDEHVNSWNRKAARVRGIFKNYPGNKGFLRFTLHDLILRSAISYHNFNKTA